MVWIGKEHLVRLLWLKEPTNAVRPGFVRLGARRAFRRENGFESRFAWLSFAAAELVARGEQTLYPKHRTAGGLFWPACCPGPW